MKFLIDHKAKGVKDVSLSYTWSGRNLMLHVGYNLVPRRMGASVTFCSGWQDGKTQDLKIWFITTSVVLSIKLIPETAKERKMVTACHAHTLSSDDNDASILLIPTLTIKEWENMKDAKEVKS